MKSKIEKYPVWSSIVIFLICIAARFVEYFAIRTDETVIAENFIHKVFGIILLLCVLKLLGLKQRDIGFKKENFLKNLGLGALLGAVCFTVSYAVEMMIISAQNGEPHLEIYASGFSITGEQVKNTGLVFMLLCVLFNIVNVWMEEGVFRGLFLNILQPKHLFWYANLTTALLFGVWHWVMPMRSYLDGTSTLANLLVMGIGYIILSGIMSIKWGMMYKMTGSLWAGLGDHLFNNVVATNLLHVVSNTGADEWQIVRILLAQVISFVIVAVIYSKNREKLSDNI